jgi:hypothetical protein
MSAESAVLFAHLDRFRRRAALVIAVRSMAIAGSAFFTCAGAAALLNVVAPAPACWWAAAATMAAAVVMTIAQLPSRRATAVMVDRRLHLHDRTVTALQCAGSPDAFSQLVVRDATSRLASADPSEAFPMRLPRMAAAGPLATGLALLMVAALPSMRGFSFGGRTLASVTGGTVRPSPARGEASRRAGTEAAARSASSTRDARTTAAPNPQTSRATESPAAPFATGVGAQGARGGNQSANDGPSLTTATAETRADSRGASAPDASPSGQSRLAGGVTGASRRRDVTRETAPRDTREYATAYRAGHAAAERAIAQDRVPAERRAYVRAYFQAIRPQVGK